MISLTLKTVREKKKNPQSTYLVANIFKAHWALIK